jgi:hypothetical protein
MHYLPNGSLGTHEGGWKIMLGDNGLVYTVVAGMVTGCNKLGLSISGASCDQREPLISRVSRLYSSTGGVWSPSFWGNSRARNGGG